MNKALALLGFATVFAASTAHAEVIKLDGIYKQGGLVAVTYQEDQVKQIDVNGKKLVLDGDGFEYYPIDRTTTKLTFTVDLKDGTQVVETRGVSKRNYKVQHVKGVKQKHVTPDPKHLARIRGESKQIRESRSYNDEKYFTTIFPEFIRPADGVTTGVFGSSRTYNGVERSWHKGLDFANKQGTPIISPLKGKVVLAMKDSYFNGNLVVIDHGKKIYSIYAHMYDIIAQKGDILEAGDPVGLVGSTGRSTGPHLHWGVYVGQQAIEPEFLLKDFKKEK
jgi:murein DD-endopeptidase MepM/ murein hydrolase activator NlpD